MRLLFPILVLLFTQIIAAENDNLPKVVKVSLADYAAAKEKIELQAQDALNVERQKLVAQLQLQLTDETQKGHLDAALAIRNLIQDLDHELDHQKVEVPIRHSIQMFQASDYCAKTGNVQIGGSYPGLVWTDGAGGSYQYNVDAPSENNYYLYVLMTAADSRPCTLYFDDKKADIVCTQVTGSWQKDNLEWFKCGPYRLSKGSHKMRIVAVKAAPHLKGFALSTNPDLHLEKNAFGD